MKPTYDELANFKNCLDNSNVENDDEDDKDDQKVLDVINKSMN